jgi:predicted phosphoribosyltransferase
MMRRHPGKLILATPVMPFDRVGQFHGLVDDLVLLAAPRKFYAVGQFYRSVRHHPPSQRVSSSRVCQLSCASEHAHWLTRARAQFGEIEDEEVLELLRDANERVRSVMTEKKGKQLESPNMDDLDALRDQRAATAATTK